MTTALPAPLPMTPGASAEGRSMGRTALVLAVIAIVLSVGSSLAVGLGLGPLQWRRETGAPLDGDVLAEGIYLGLTFAQVIWIALATVGLVLGIVAAVRDRGRAPAIAAILVAVLGPVASFLLFAGLSVASLPTG